MMPRAATPIGARAWWLLGLMTADYVLGMIDRNAMSVLKTTIKGALHLNDSAYGWLVTAFLLPYSLFYIICGRIVDRFGSRATFAAFVTIWSIATIGCGLSASFGGLLFWRIVLGAAEAGLLPATIYALVKWFPQDRIAFAYAVKTPFQSLGAILSPPVIAFLALALGWRAGFFVPGAIGLVFATLWYLSDRNPPAYPEQRAASEGPAPTLRDLLRNRVLWGILLARLVSDPVWFFFQNWQAGYMQERLGASLSDVGALLWLPPLVTSVLTFATAGLSERLVRRGWDPAGARLRVMQGVAVLGPLILSLPFVGGIPWFLVVVTTSYLMGYTWLYLSNVLMTDLFPRRTVGTAVGLVNAVGTLGAAGFNALAGPIIDAHGYTPLFLFLGLVHPMAAIIVGLFYRDRLRRR